jgi:rubredoxin
MNQKSLIKGRMMICPRCKRSSDILSYIRLETIEEFAAETTPVYKCSFCKWLFSPAGAMEQDIYAKFEALLAQYETRECECSKS